MVRAHPAKAEEMSAGLEDAGTLRRPGLAPVLERTITGKDYVVELRRIAAARLLPFLTFDATLTSSAVATRWVR